MAKITTELAVSKELDGFRMQIVEQTTEALMSTTSTAGAYFSWKYWSRKRTKLESNAQEKKNVNPKTNQPILKEAQNIGQKAIVEDGNRK